MTLWSYTNLTDSAQGEPCLHLHEVETRQDRRAGESPLAGSIPIRLRVE